VRCDLNLNPGIGRFGTAFGPNRNKKGKRRRCGYYPETNMQKTLMPTTRVSAFVDKLRWFAPESTRQLEPDLIGTDLRESRDLGVGKKCAY